MFVESIMEVITTGPTPNDPVPLLPAITSPTKNAENPSTTAVVIVAVYGPVGAPATVPMVHARPAMFDNTQSAPLPETTVAVSFLINDIGSIGAYFATEI